MFDHAWILISSFIRTFRWAFLIILYDWWLIKTSKIILIFNRKFFHLFLLLLHCLYHIDFLLQLCLLLLVPLNLFPHFPCHLMVLFVRLCILLLFPLRLFKINSDLLILWLKFGSLLLLNLQILFHLSKLVLQRSHTLLKSLIHWFILLILFLKLPLHLHDQFFLFTF